MVEKSMFPMFHIKSSTRHGDKETVIYKTREEMKE